MKDPGGATTDRGNPLLVPGYRLLRVAAPDIPEHDLGQLITMRLKLCLCIRKVGCSGIQNQVEHRLKVGVCHLIEACHITQPICKGIALDFNQLRSAGKRNEMVLECAGVVFGKGLLRGYNCQSTP